VATMGDQVTKDRIKAGAGTMCLSLRATSRAQYLGAHKKMNPAAYIGLAIGFILAFVFDQHWGTVICGFGLGFVFEAIFLQVYPRRG
jgi:tetrahydromethanopterin S-methyltransferase subunit F